MGNKIMLSNNQKAFLALVRAGLWEKEVELSEFGNINWQTVYTLAEQQAVTGLVTAGLEHVVDVRPPQEILLTFVGASLQIEQRNKAMNEFIASLVTRMRNASIYTLLVKGQGVAQCYEKPLWRSSGDVDLLLSESNYGLAKKCLQPLSSSSMPEERYSRHLGMVIDQWCVEVHGTLRTGLSGRVDRVVDDVQKDLFFGGNVRSWMDGKSQVFLPAATNDVFLVFTHFIKHFYKEGMNLRQVCDWARLMWTYRERIDVEILRKWIARAKLLAEWNSFAVLAVEYLGMPKESMPLYPEDGLWSRKAHRIMMIVLREEKWDKWRDTMRVSRIMPLSVLRFAPGIFLNINSQKIIERLWKDDTDIEQ